MRSSLILLELLLCCSCLAFHNGGVVNSRRRDSLRKPAESFHSETAVRQASCSLQKNLRTSTLTSPKYAKERQRRQSIPSTKLCSTSSQGNEENQKNNNNPKNLLSRVVQKLMSNPLLRPKQFVSRFRSLSKRAKKLVIAQMIVFACIFGSFARIATVDRTVAASRRPVEIAYSSFLDLVELQQQQSLKAPTTGRATASATADNAVPTPVIDRVRIGTDRIAFRIYRNINPQTELVTPNKHTPSKQLTKTQKQQAETTATATAADVAVEKSKQISKRTKRQPPPYLMAYTKKVPASPELVNLLRKNDISFAAAPSRTSVVMLTVRSFFLCFYMLFLYRMYKAMTNATGGGNSSKDTPGKLAQTSDLPMASFDDIQGIDNVKNEVMELVDTLRNPEKYAILGARAPTGLLLEGPPGTGKTMLARATAATAGVPLLYCSGSDFVEMFVGRGAARVRKLFERAERLSPCIVFIDELDALGKSRDMGSMAGFSRSNDEAEQTLNQLLACMDGLETSKRVCVLAATNRKEVLDPALIRPGRFDRIVKLKLPDAAGREKILRVHCKKLPGFQEGKGVDPNRAGALGKERVVDLSAIAAVTDGFSGAELEFLVNEAAIRAVRRVSAALRAGTHSSDITPHVDAKDFEASLKSFYENRRPKNSFLESILK